VRSFLPSLACSVALIALRSVPPGLEMDTDDDEHTTKCDACGAINACAFPEGYELVKKEDVVAAGGLASDEGKVILDQLPTLSDDDLRAIASLATSLYKKRVAS